MVAIILVNYNGLNDTIECIESIKKSIYDDYKIIVVENASDDIDIIQQNEYIKVNADLIILKENLGFSGGNNQGILFAKERYNPDYYFLLNNDTVIEKFTINYMLKAFDKYYRVGIVTCRIPYYKKRNYLWNGEGSFDDKLGIADQPYMGKKSTEDEYECIVNFASGCAMLISKDVVKDVGVLSEKYFMYAEDTDYCCRVRNANYNIVYTNNGIVYHKVSASTGEDSDFQIYYMFRNNCFIIKQYSVYPILGYIKLWYRMIKKDRLKKHRKIVNKAWKDFRSGINGKVEI